MSGAIAVQTEAAPIVACTISKNIQDFDLLIEDMEAEFGESWGDLTFEEAEVFLDQPESAALKYVIAAFDEDDGDTLSHLNDLIRQASAKKLSVLLVSEDVGPGTLHQLLGLGAKQFLPYPLPEGALKESIQKIREAEVVSTRLQDAPRATAKISGDHDGVVLVAHGMGGGTGASTFACNLAWELATLSKTDQPKVCLIDLDLQFGAVASYLDLSQREAVFELLSDLESMDRDSFMQALTTFNDRLHVLTAPPELVPLEIVSPPDIEKLIETARTNFDYVVIDMPKTVVHWTETILNAAHVYFVLLELELRTAQNTQRLVRALKSEQLPYEKLRYVLNRAPKFTDLSGKSRVKRLAESLDIKLEVQLSDGGKQIVEACEQGLPLAEVASKNPLRKDIQKLAVSVQEVNADTETGD